MTEFLNWAVALMATFFEWLGDMQLVEGVSPGCLCRCVRAWCCDSVLPV